MKTTTLLPCSLLVLLLFVLSPRLALYGQTPTDAHLICVPDSGGKVKVKIHIVLADSVTFGAVEIKLGKHRGDSDLVYIQIPGAGSLPSGVSMINNNGTLTVEIPAVTKSNTYFSEVKVQSTSGAWSTPYRFISN